MDFDENTVLNPCENRYEHIFPSCRRILGKYSWGRILTALENNDKDTQKYEPKTFADKLSFLKKKLQVPAFIDDLARVEWSWHQTKNQASALKKSEKILPEKIMVNPDLILLPVSWKNLPAMIGAKAPSTSPAPENEPTHVMIWPHPKKGELQIRDAEDIDLLALKIIIEEIDPRQAATIGNINVRKIQAALDRAIGHGILISPPSLICRTFPDPSPPSATMPPFMSADIFTLQWHITQACDLHCKHCYDRSDRASMPREMALDILDDFYAFCRDMHIRGQITFTGGNPLLYPLFEEIYREAADRGFGIAILGNPAPADQIEKLVKIEKPVFFQISLEGLADHNDYIRGNGHFERSLAFLDDLRAMDIYSMVMLTLTRDNQEQVLPLGRLLTDRADHFTFNRLATVGEARELLMPEKNNFKAFLKEYAAAADKNPMLGLKDNLFNIIRNEQGISLFGGCTGYGCGAAFNFVALLPDGEVHACRKFPSPIGNIRKNRLADIYGSDLAEKYRTGSRACHGCRLNAVCRGCLAVTYSHGLDIFKDKDPFCFLSE